MKSYFRGFLLRGGEKKIGKHRARARNDSNEVLLTHGRDLGGTGEWCCLPRQQSPRGGKMNIWNEKKLFSTFNKILIF